MLFANACKILEWPSIWSNCRDLNLGRRLSCSMLSKSNFVWFRVSDCKCCSRSRPLVFFASSTHPCRESHRKLGHFARVSIAGSRFTPFRVRLAIASLSKCSYISGKLVIFIPPVKLTGRLSGQVILSTAGCSRRLLDPVSSSQRPYWEQYSRGKYRWGS